MSKRNFRLAVLVFIAAIGITFTLYAVISGIRATGGSAVLIAKSGQPDFEFWEFVERGAEEGAREFGVDLRVTGPASEEDAEGQTRLVYEAISENPDAIILAPCDENELREAAQAVCDAGIALILMDSDLGDAEHIEDCFVGIDNKAAGRFLAEQMARSLPEGGEVAILVTVPGASNAADRVEGILGGLEAYPEITVTEIASCGDSVSASAETTEQILGKYPDLDGIFGTNPVCAEGAARVLRERSAHHVYLYAFDTSASQNEYLEEGTVDGFVAQIAFNLGYLSVEAGYQASRGLLRTRHMDSGYVYATKENMREEHIQKLIYPFV